MTFEGIRDTYSDFNCITEGCDFHGQFSGAYDANAGTIDTGVIERNDAFVEMPEDKARHMARTHFEETGHDTFMISRGYQMKLSTNTIDGDRSEYERVKHSPITTTDLMIAADQGVLR